MYFRSTSFFHCVCALELFCSTSCPDPSWVCSTRVFSDKLQASNHARRDLELPWSIWSTEFLVKTFSSISWEWDVSPSTTNTSCMSSGCPDRSQIGFRLVGTLRVEFLLETVDQLYLLAWSTVEPIGTFPLVQSWSCRNEIFGGGRGDMYRMSILFESQY